HPAGGDGEQGVGRVVAAGQRHAQHLTAPGHGGAGPVLAQVGHVVDRDPGEGAAAGVEQQSTVDVVEVDHRGAARAGFEELRLGGEVGLRGAVEVQVVDAQVGEHGDV